MNVIVNASGFYGGTWYDAGPQEQDIADKVAKPFLPPFGTQLSLPQEKKTASVGTAKTDEKSS